MFFTNRVPDIFGERPPRAPIALRKKPLATRNFPPATRKIFISEVKWPLFWTKKAERTRCWWALSASLYKDTTFCREKQIALTFRNTPSDCNLQRFAADGAWRVLYYEAQFVREIIPPCDRGRSGEYWLYRYSPCLRLTFRNTPAKVKMRRFAAASIWRVLYYEGHTWKATSLGAKKGRRGLNPHRLRFRTIFLLFVVKDFFHRSICKRTPNF